MMSAENGGQTGGLRFSRLRLTADLAKNLSELDKKGSSVYTGFAEARLIS